MAIGLLDGAFTIRSGAMRGGIVAGNHDTGKSVWIDTLTPATFAGP